MKSGTKVEQRSKNGRIRVLCLLHRQAKHVTKKNFEAKTTADIVTWHVRLLNQQHDELKGNLEQDVVRLQDVLSRSGEERKSRRVFQLQRRGATDTNSNSNAKSEQRLKGKDIKKICI